jgi:hypothetical protein
MQDGLLHSTSRGLSQGNHTGMGFREKQGAGTTTALHVPGMQIDALPNDTHGRILNSVLTMVGQMGISKGSDTGPTVSAGTGMSGRHRPVMSPPPRQKLGVNETAHMSITTTANRDTTIILPRIAKRLSDQMQPDRMVPFRRCFCQEPSVCSGIHSLTDGECPWPILACQPSKSTSPLSKGELESILRSYPLLVGGSGAKALSPGTMVTNVD